MYTNKVGCTIYECTTVNRAPAYIRHVVGPLYWQPATGETGGKDRTENNSIFVSIPEISTDYLPKPDDRIVPDIIDDAAPPQTAYTIMTVKDLRFGSPRVKHIELSVR